MNTVEILEKMQIFKNSLCDVVNTISGISLEEVAINDSTLNIKPIENTIAGISLVGELQGMLFIYANTESLKCISSYTIGVPQEDISENDIHDCISELLNMVAGHAKVRFASEGNKFHVETPFVIFGDNMNMVLKKNLKKFECYFKSSNVSLGLKLLL